MYDVSAVAPVADLAEPGRRIAACCLSAAARRTTGGALPGSASGLELVKPVSCLPFTCQTETCAFAPSAAT